MWAESVKTFQQPNQRETHAFLFLFSFNPFLSLLHSVAPPNRRDPPSALRCPPLSPSFLLSVPLFFCFVRSPSLALSPLFPPPVCTLWYADMQEFRPQNDRPNLSVLAPVTKDGRPARVRGCHWRTPELRSPRLVVFSQSPSELFFSFFSSVGQKCEHWFLFVPAPFSSSPAS